MPHFEEEACNLNATVSFMNLLSKYYCRRPVYLVLELFGIWYVSYYWPQCRVGTMVPIGIGYRPSIGIGVKWKQRLLDSIRKVVHSRARNQARDFQAFGYELNLPLDH